MTYEQENFIDTQKMVWNFSLFTQKDIENFQKGNLFNGYEKFGSHQIKVLETTGFYFAVWAPNATAVSVVGEFNGWKKQLHPLFVRLDKSGIWEGFIPRLPEETIYKYQITGFEGAEVLKADPYAVYAELRPATASITRHLNMHWQDEDWMQTRKSNNSLQAPVSVYEVHLGSWMRPDKTNENGYTSYLDLIERLVPYVKNMGFTHVELMPVMEFPYDGSWGYQCTGFFAASSRFGKPEELMALINAFHQQNIGVILDWVPSHFPADEHGLYRFDGTHTYEYADRRKGFHVDWNSYIFNYSRAEVVSFLISSAHFWLKYFHADGIRVDAVNSILRLDFSRQEGEWEPNEDGGNENKEAVVFLKKLNDSLSKYFPDVLSIAEEASDWPDITTPTAKNGLGFHMKWMMGWMHDSFTYFKKLPLNRVLAQNDLTFSMHYFYDEVFMLPLSHDEVVHGKSPMIYKMPGNEWEQFANLRLLYAYMFTHPGAKLLFMGNEFGQTSEWNYKSELDWNLLQYESHNGLQECVRKLNFLYQEQPALHQLQYQVKGFEWVDIYHASDGILVYKRKAKDKNSDLLMVMNVTNIAHDYWPVKVKGKLNWQEIFNSNDSVYWGSGLHLNPNIGIKIVDKKARLVILKINIPSFGFIILQ